MKKHRIHIIVTFFVVLSAITGFVHSKDELEDDKGLLTIRFVHIANGSEITLRDSTYLNAFNEQYTVSKLRYYISNISLQNNEPLPDSNNYQLIDLANSTSFTIPVNEGKYNQIDLLLGIDSLRHCSGAQEGVLDPMRDMFWTWNTGYVIFKLEGRSPASSAKQRIEHHVGGYRFGNNVSTPLTLKFKDELKIKKGSNAELLITVNLDNYWNSVNPVKLKDDPLCTLPGVQAKKIAANLPALFSVASIKQTD